jgi:HAD superfamily hydrolase (TIGR01509 family)
MDALIFDFDGLILDTELSELQSWREIYTEYNADLPLEQWAKCIGSGADSFDPIAFLEAQIGRRVERDDILTRRRKRHLEQLAAEVLLPGVETYLHTAKRLGMKIGLASSSSRNWVSGHLTRLGIADFFDVMKCGDEVAHKKPDPELYLGVLSAFNISGDKAIALEDSPNGVLAAQRAGIFCVAIPNPVTSQLDLAHADLRLKSLALMPLEELIAEVEKRRQTASTAGVIEDGS